MTEIAIQVIGLIGMAVVAFVFAGGMLPLMLLIVAASCDLFDMVAHD